MGGSRLRPPTQRRFSSRQVPPASPRGGASRHRSANKTPDYRKPASGRFGLSLNGARVAETNHSVELVGEKTQFY